jgi:16S rRNA (guanine527-N7)-methyltransferase
VADGSGNGSPVVPLAVCCPTVSFTAIEARRRRAAFIATVEAALGLRNLVLKACRVEEVILQQPASFNVVLSRAFARPPLMLGLARQMLTPTGEVRGFSGADVAEAAQAADMLGYREFTALRYESANGVRHVWRASMPLPRPGL